MKCHAKSWALHIDATDRLVHLMTVIHYCVSASPCMIQDYQKHQSRGLLDCWFHCSRDLVLKSLKSRVIYGLWRYSGLRSTHVLSVCLKIAKKCLHGKIVVLKRTHSHDGYFSESLSSILYHAEVVSLLTLKYSFPSTFMCFFGIAGSCLDTVQAMFDKTPWSVFQECWNSWIVSLAFTTVDEVESTVWQQLLWDKLTY